MREKTYAASDGDMPKTPLRR